MESSGTSERPYKVKIKKNLKGTYTYEFVISGNSIEFLDEGITNVKELIDKKIDRWRQQDAEQPNIQPDDRKV